MCAWSIFLQYYYTIFQCLSVLLMSFIAIVARANLHWSHNLFALVNSVVTKLAISSYRSNFCVWGEVLHHACMVLYSVQYMTLKFLAGIEILFGHACLCTCTGNTSIVHGNVLPSNTTGHVWMKMYKKMYTAIK